MLLKKSIYGKFFEIEPFAEVAEREPAADAITIQICRMSYFLYKPSVIASVHSSSAVLLPLYNSNSKGSPGAVSK